MEIVEQQNEHDHFMEREQNHGNNNENDLGQSVGRNDKQQQLLRDFERAVKQTNKAHMILQNIIEELSKEFYDAAIKQNENGKSTNNRQTERSRHGYKRQEKSNCNCVTDSNTSDSDLDYLYWEHHPRHMRWKCHRHGRHLKSRHHFHRHRSHSRN